MKFNICLTGPAEMMHVRRDLLMLFKYGLESLGHDAIITLNAIDKNWINILVTPQFLPPKDMLAISNSGYQYFSINTEIIANGMMNFNPQKVDMLGAWVPMARKSLGVMDIVENNMPEYARYQINARFLRWAYHERVEELRHCKDKDLDYYFFGAISPRRTQMMQLLDKKGFRGFFHDFCPHFMRGSFIERAKIQLAITQDDVYSHIANIRLCYLANNRCAILCEQAEDPTGYLAYAKSYTAESFVESFSELMANNAWKRQSQESYELFRQTPFTPILEEVLDHFLGGEAAASATNK